MFLTHFYDRNTNFKWSHSRTILLQLYKLLTTCGWFAIFLNNWIQCLSTAGAGSAEKRMCLLVTGPSFLDLVKSRETHLNMSRDLLIWFLKLISIFIVSVLVTSMTLIVALDLRFNHLFFSQSPKPPSPKQTLRSLESTAITEDTIWIVDTSGDEEVFLKPLQLCGLESAARFMNW